MTKIISLPFEYLGKEYYTLIRARSMPECTVFKITIMNGELEQAMHGDNIVEYRNGIFISRKPEGENEPSVLKRRILDMLEEYVLSHPIQE